MTPASVASIVSRSTAELISTLAADEPVVASPAADPVLATSAVDDVVAPETNDDIVARRPAQHVTSRCANDGGAFAKALRHLCLGRRSDCRSRRQKREHGNQGNEEVSHTKNAAQR